MSEQNYENQDSQYDSLQLVGRHVPGENSGPFKSLVEARDAGHDTLAPVTGTYEIGVLVDGAFVTIFEESAGRFHNLIEVAKAAQPQQGESQGQ